MVRTLDYSVEVPGLNPTRVLFFDYIIEDKVFENSKSQCYRILMVYVLSTLHCWTNSEQISRPAAGRIDSAFFFWLALFTYIVLGVPVSYPGLKI